MIADNDIFSLMILMSTGSFEVITNHYFGCKKYLLRQAKKCRRTCAKCTDSDCLAHARSICSLHKFCYIDYSVSGQ